MRSTVLLLCLLTWSSLAFASPRDFNATKGYGVFHSAATNPFFAVEITAATLASETTEPDGRKRLSFNFTVRNPDGGYQEEVAVFIDSQDLLPWPVEFVSIYAEAGDLAPGTPAAPTVATTFNSASFLIAAADAEAAKAAILARQHIHLSCKELYQLTMPIHEADAAMSAAFTDGTSFTDSRTLHFSSMTPSLAALQPNTILVHNPSVFTLPDPPITGEEVLQPHLTDVDKADGDFGQSKQPTKVMKVTSVVINPNMTVTVNGDLVRVWDHMSSAIYAASQRDGYRGVVTRDPWNPPNGTSFHTGRERFLRGYDPTEDSGYTSTGFPNPIAADYKGLFTLHYPFNDLQLAPGVTLDGEFLFRGLEIDVDGVIRDEAKLKIAFKLTNHVETTMRLTAEAGTSLLDIDQTLLYTSLPPAIIPVFQLPITFRPVFTVKAGASVTALSRIQVPFHSAVNAGYQMLFDGSKPVGSQFTFKPIYNATPLKSSKPSLGRAVHMDATAWVEAGMDIVIQELAGPGISVRATGNLDVRPLANPWWTVNADVKLNGQFSFGLFGFNFFSIPATLFTSPPILNIDAGGPHVPTSLTGPLDKAEGEHVRWGRAVRWNSALPTSGNACRVKGTTEDVFAVMNASTPPTTLMRISDKGDRVWSHSVGEALQHVVGTNDGGVILGGGGNGVPGVRLLKYDGSGNRLWERNLLFSHTDTLPPQLTVARILIRDTGSGSQELHIVGSRIRNATSRHVDGFLIRCDDAGNSLGTVSFDSADYTVVRDAAYTPNGGIIFAGMNQPSPDEVSFPGPGTVTTGWLMKTDLLGDIKWNRGLQSYRGNQFHSVAVAPTGEIYTCGFLTTVVGNPYGSMQVTRHNADGELISAQTLSEASDSLTVDDYAVVPDQTNAAQIGETNPTNPVSTTFPQWLPNSGRTIWDEGRRIVWSDNGLIVTSTTALGTSRAATVACLTQNLAVRWFTVHEKEDSEEYLFDIIPTADGLFALGSTSQFLGFNTGSTNSFTNHCALFLKLPMDGKCDLHPGTKGIHKFLQPGMHDHRNDQGDLKPPYSPHYQPSITGQSNLTHSNITGTTSAGPALFSFQFTEPTFTHWVPLEAGDANAPMTYNQWASYWQLPLDSEAGDVDNDGRSNSHEWFFGGDPSTFDPGPPVLGIASSAGNLTFTTTRSRAATGATPLFETSTTLGSWDSLSPGIIQSTAQDAFTDRLTFSIPITNEPRRFYRVAAP